MLLIDTTINIAINTTINNAAISISIVTIKSILMLSININIDYYVNINISISIVLVLILVLIKNRRNFHRCKFIRTYQPISMNTAFLLLLIYFNTLAIYKQVRS